MKKYFIAISLLFLLDNPSFAQVATINQIVQRKVDSLKKGLATVKGNTRVDYLNNISHGFNWIYDYDTPNLFDSACTYANLAFNEAKRLKYKRGLGYAYLQMQHCEAGNAWDDTSRGPNSHYAQAEKYSKMAIQIGEELEDNVLIGSSYNTIQWFEKWKGDQKRYREYAKKALEYFEKPLKSQPKGSFVLLTYTDCISCGSNDYMLGLLNAEVSNFQNSSTRITMLEKAIDYYIKSNDLSSASAAYNSLAIALTFTVDIDKSISVYKKAISLAQTIHDEPTVFNGYIRICDAYYTLGDFENGITYSKKSVELAEKYTNPKGDTYTKNDMLYQSYSLVGKFYSIANDFVTAFAFMKKARLYVSNYSMPTWAAAYGEIHRMNNNYDSAMYYITVSKSKVLLSTLFLSMKQYDKVLELTDKWKTTIPANNVVSLGKVYSWSAGALYGKNDYDKALTDARLAFSLSKQSKRTLDLIDNYQLLSDIFSKLGKNDSAFIYLKEYLNLRDSVMNRQFYIRLNDYKKESEELKRTSSLQLLQKNYIIKEQMLKAQMLLEEQRLAQLSLLDKSGQIKDQQLLIQEQRIKEQTLLKEKNQSQLVLLDKQDKIKSQQLKQQNYVRKALLAGLFLLTGLGFLGFRVLIWKRRNEKLANEKNQAKLQQKAAELEMQALRAQMNPHFIFNCLNSINRFIYKTETAAASDYLTRFSRLIRMVLLNSQKKLITLEDELEMLRLYLDMERLRFKDAFNYRITTTNAVETRPIFIPPLLLQPFCENAIWHGLMHKDSPGHLDIEINEANGVLVCIVTDDGIGRAKAEELKSKSATQEKSLGLKITRERLSLLNQGSTGGTFYKMEDVRDQKGEIAGTRVKLEIHYKETVEEQVPA